MSIMPGIETRAPERTETSMGREASPNLRPITRSTLAKAESASRFTSSGICPPPRLYSAQTAVEMVKPDGTGTSRRVISARFAPLPPSRLLISRSPSARSPVKV